MAELNPVIPHTFNSDADNKRELPLAGMRVVEIADGKTEMCGRFLAELGADVILLEYPGGVDGRNVAPIAKGLSVRFQSHHAGKRSLQLDLTKPADFEQFEALIAHTDLLIAAGNAGAWPNTDANLTRWRALNPTLVVLSVTDFGLFGPYRDYVATNAVHAALGGILCRSGQPGREPLLPPGQLAYETAAVQAAWVALLGHWQCLERGEGDLLDFSVLDATAQVIDPGFGVAGSAAVESSTQDPTLRGRPQVNPMYPIFPCKDGYVRICVLAPRQWQGMSEWLGADHPFTDASYRVLAKRKQEPDRINACIAKFFSLQTKADLVGEGQRRGVPIAALTTPADVLRNPHFQARGAFIPFQSVTGERGQMPSGYAEIDGRRAGPRRPAPALGQHTSEIIAELAALLRPSRSDDQKAMASRRRPLTGIRVLDLGIIVAGAETGRLFADQGAEVIKIESRAFPDGSRQTMPGAVISESFAQGHRGKSSLGIDLKSPRGLELFKQLVAQSDVVLSNYKPGTLESLGIDYGVLKKINPRIVMGDSSALGRTGPESRSMGYGPLVRTSSGLTEIWRYPDDPESFSDGVTIFPDHFAARAVATGVLALLTRRRRTGLGGTVRGSQAECILMTNSAEFLRESLEPGTFVARGNTSEFNAPEGVYACSGDDEWCVVAVRDDDDWLRFAAAIGRPELLQRAEFAHAAGRIQGRDELDDIVGEWTSRHTPHEVTAILQAAGVPAAFMQRLPDYEDNPQFRARGFIRTLLQPGIEAPLNTQNGPVHARHLPDPCIRPAPFQGEHTREIAARLLHLAPAEIEALIVEGVLETQTVSIGAVVVPNVATQ